jgi:hypothetical protein
MSDYALKMGDPVDVYIGTNLVQGTVKAWGNATGPLVVVVPEEKDDKATEEEFCARCAAGVDSPEHHARCVVTGHAHDGESAYGLRYEIQ